MKKMIAGMILMLAFLVLCTMHALAEGGALSIDTETVYEGMPKSYAEGYVPAVSGGNAMFVLPLRSSDPAVTSITVTPVIGTDEQTPFSYGNYEFNVLADANGVFVVRLSLPLKANRVNGTYCVAFRARYTDGAGAAQTQEFPVYLTIADGMDPNAPEPSEAPAGLLAIDGKNLYPGMAKTYAEGYMPLVENGRVHIVLPLVGATYDGRVTVTADLGATTDSPFVYGNYSQTATPYGWGGLYLFSFEIPLAGGRYNGSYPVILRAEYLNARGAQTQQAFTVYVTVTDGKNPPDPNDVQKVEAERPELFISQCVIEPTTVGGNEVFTVRVTVENIGNIRARSVKLSWSSAAPGILPAETANAKLLENIAAGECAEASFQLKTTKDVLAGSQPFTVALDYVDLYGGTYTASREFLVHVTQPVELSYDTISVPKEIAAGETLSLPANVFNVGKAPLRNVSVTVAGAGLFPTSTVFLGDIAPGEAGYGELKVFVGMLSMTEGYSQSYGLTHGVYTITYYDDNDAEHTAETEFTLEIKQPVIESAAEPEEDPQPVIQWWVAVLAGFAAIAILVAALVVSRFLRAWKMTK